MACADTPVFVPAPFVSYALARITRDPPRITQWWAGPLVGWSNCSNDALLFAHRSNVEQLREQLGGGVVIQMYEVFTGEYLGDV